MTGSPDLEARLPKRPVSAHGRRREPASGTYAKPRPVELKDLWWRYTDRADETARDRLVRAYSHLVEDVVGRMARRLPSHVDRDELISYGLLGLMKAVERFDPARQIKFETFAKTRIQGQIIDELRALDWVPRSVRAKARDIQKVHVALEHELLRTPTDHEMAARLNVSVQKFHSDLLEISKSSVVALDELWTLPDSSGDQAWLRDTIRDPDAVDPLTATNQSEIKDRLADIIGTLPERQRLVVALYYYEDLTLREISEVLGVTESRVSQMRTAAVLRMKSQLAHGMDVASDAPSSAAWLIAC